jgi:hypothetical protein
MIRPSAEVTALPPPEAVIDRSGLAQDIVKYILDNPSRVVVLHGKPASGKTELLQRWVLPALRNRGGNPQPEAWYGDCSPGVPDALQGAHGEVPLRDAAARDGIVVIDSFERVLDLSRNDRRAALDGLFAEMGRPGAKARLLLVTNTRQLSSVYSLAAYEPAITGAVLEVRSVGVVEGLQQLLRVQPETAADCDPAVLEAVAADAARMEKQGWDVTVAFIRLIDARFRDYRRDSGEAVIRLEHYQAMGGLTGVLRAHMDQCLESLFPDQEDSQLLARAVLERVQEAGARGTPSDFTDLPARLGVAQDRLEPVIAGLLGPGGLVRVLPGGGHELVPPQLDVVIADDVARRNVDNERLAQLVAEGLRSWQRLGNLLPRARFEEVHRARASLILDSDQIRFLMQCAIRDEGPGLEGAAAYWVHRVSDREDAMGILLACLYSDLAEVRLQAASLLREFPADEVRDRLRALALDDPESSVRAQAVTSLSLMPSPELKEQLFQAVQDRQYPHRAEAIEALRIFPDEDAARRLKALVNDPDSPLELRATAIRVLAHFNIPVAIDALVDIALLDDDEEDRLAAAEALALTESVDLNRHLLARLRAPSPVRRLRLAAVLTSVLALVAVASCAAFILRLGEAATGFLAVGSVLLLYPTRRLLHGLRDDRIKRSSLAGALAAVLFALGTGFLFFLIHGLAHFLIARWRKGLTYLGYEILGCLAFVLAILSQRIPGVGGSLAWIYTVVAVLLFLGSYLWDVVGVAFETLVLTGTTQLESRRALIYRHGVGNPVTAAALFEALKSPTPGEAGEARDLLRRFGGSVQSRQLVELLQAQDSTNLPYVLRALQASKPEETVRQLEALWQRQDTALRQRIARVLYRQPTQRSLQALDSLHDDMGPVLRLRAGAAWWQFVFAGFPLITRLAMVLCLPTLGVVLYHGWHALTDETWSITTSLRSPYTPEKRKVEEVNFLATEFPQASADQLLDYYLDTRDHPSDHVHAALTRGLVRIHSWETTRRLTFLDSDKQAKQAALRGHLLAAADSYAPLLAGSDQEFEEALGVFRVMADAEDSALGAAGVRVLVGFVAQGRDTDRGRRIKVIDSLGAVRYERALLALDTLTFVSNQEWDIKDSIRSEMEVVTVRAYGPISLRSDLPEQGQRLVAVLNLLKVQPLPPKVAQARADLVDRVRMTSQPVSTDKCDSDGDGRCTARDSALAVITGDPESEQGYRELLDSYLGDSSSVPEGAYGAALAAEPAFARLERLYPKQVWPRKLRSELEHEYLAPHDPAWFGRSYEEFADLRALPAYAQVIEDEVMFWRFEADFVEVALSARQYKETDSLARTLLARSPRPVYQLNLRLFVYLASAVQGDRAAALMNLDALGAAIDSLPANFYNGWIYPGTIAFIAQSKLPGTLPRALTSLCRQDYWYTPAEAAAVIASNRTAWRRLP